MAGLLLAALGVCLGRSIEKAWWTVEDRRDRRREEKLEKLEKEMSGSKMPGVGRRRNPEMNEKERRERREKRSSVFVDPLNTNLYDHSIQLSSTHPSTTTTTPDPHAPLRRPRSRLSTLRNRHSLFLPSSKRHSGAFAFSTSGESSTGRSWTRGRSRSGSGGATGSDADADADAEAARRRGKRTTWHGWATLHAHAHAHGEADADVLGEYVALIEEEEEEEGYELLEMAGGDAQGRRGEGEETARRRSVGVGGGRRGWRGSCDTLVAGDGGVGSGKGGVDMF